MSTNKFFARIDAAKKAKIAKAVAYLGRQDKATAKRIKNIKI